MRFTILILLFTLSSCSLLFEPIGLGGKKKSQEQLYTEQFGTIKDYPNVKEFRSSELMKNCKHLGDYFYESSWDYESMKLVFYKHVKENSGNAFYRVDTNKKAGLLSELNRYEIRYYKCQK